MSSTPASSENAVAVKYDRCLADLVVKTGIGFGAGVVASVIFFRRRTWPIAFATGTGVGSSWADCDRLFNPARVPGTKLAVLPPRPIGSPAVSPSVPGDHKHVV